MWNFYSRKMVGDFVQSPDLINSPFAHPRLPPRSNPPLGVSNVGKIKDDILQDSSIMMNRLSDNHSIFQRYASGLFNFTPNRFIPGHPIHMKMQDINSLAEENEKLRKENVSLRSDLDKVKKK